MKLQFSHECQAGKQKVWDTMLDPGVLERIIPGVESFDIVAEDEYAAVMKLGIPAVKGEYKGSVKVQDKNPFDSYVLAAEGKGVQGWAKGTAKVSFQVVSESVTQMAVVAEAQIGGRMAGVGQRMMEGVAKMLAEEFFADFDKELKGQQVTAAGPIQFFFRALLRLLGLGPK